MPSALWPVERPSDNANRSRWRPAGQRWRIFGHSRLFVSNDDNNDPWGVRLYLAGVSYVVPSFTILDPGDQTFLSLSFTPGTVTEFGFEVDYPRVTGSDNFHISVVPVPAALILGLLGMGAAGLRLRRFA